MLREWTGHVTPTQRGFEHVGGGIIEATQPGAETLIVTMTGVAVAGAHPCHDSVAAQDFDFVQEIDLVTTQPGTKLRLAADVRAIGMLRTHAKGTAEEAGEITVTHGPDVILSLGPPPRTVSDGQSVSVNDAETKSACALVPGRYTLHVLFRTAARHPRCVLPCKAASAEYAPDPALDPIWISAVEAFRGAEKQDFGFRVKLVVTPE